MRSPLAQTFGSRHKHLGGEARPDGVVNSKSKFVRFRYCLLNINKIHDFSKKIKKYLVKNISPFIQFCTETTKLK